MHEKTAIPGLLGLHGILYAVPISVPILLVGLSLLASLSPLCTFASFWQMKEWRWDRLREHMEREGLAVLFSKVRTALLVLALIALVFHLSSVQVILLSFLSLLAIFAASQFVLRRQPFPVWTSKAIVLTGTAIIFDLLLATALTLSTVEYSLAVLPFIQFAILAAAWALLFPLDRYLKRKTFRMARTVREQFPDLRVIGITGSVGKTTTKELIAHVLKDLHPLSTPAHVNSEMGVARWLISALREIEKNSTQPLIVEMGAYRSDEIAQLCRITQPLYGVVTFIGSQHLALFGSQEALIRAKGELLESLPATGKAFLNGDSELCLQMRNLCVSPVTVIGTGEHAEMMATEIEETKSGLRFRIGETHYGVPLHGTHNVANILLAISVGEEFGLRPEAIAEKLKTFSPLHRTFEVREERGVTILDDTHNASAASFQAAVTWADTQPFEHKVLLASGIIELGEENARTHREIGVLASGVFEKVYFLDKKSGALFGEGFGRRVDALTTNVAPLDSSSLLVCVGRMPPSIIQSLLP